MSDKEKGFWLGVAISAAVISAAIIIVSHITVAHASGKADRLPVHHNISVKHAIV